MTTITDSPVQDRDVPSAALNEPSTEPANWPAKARRLASGFATRAANCDETDDFVSDNYADLKAGGFFSAGVPASLGGGGASYSEMCEIVRQVGRGCSSTALALSMHFHLVAALVWRWRNLNAPVGEFLSRIAREQLVLVSSGGSDWLDSSGKAEPVEGGYRIEARKVFSSGCPVGDLLMTSAILDDPVAGPTVLHFPLPIQCDQVKILSTWKTLGMRGTGSNDLLIEGAFVPASAVSVRRPRGRWHPAMHLVAKVALPLIYSAYLGLERLFRDVQAARFHPLSEKPQEEMAGRLALGLDLDAG
jgi:alkylation response protein AidB-like acyl-CoA dehydrogenase